MMPPPTSSYFTVMSRDFGAEGRKFAVLMLTRTIREMTLLCLCAALPALVWGGYHFQTPKSAKIETATMGEVLWIDARSDAEFAKEHIPGALSLNERNWERALPRLFETWQPPRSIIVYCSAGCLASAKIAAKLVELGIEPVQVMEGGYEEWKRSNG